MKEVSDCIYQIKLKYVLIRRLDTFAGQAAPSDLFPCNGVCYWQHRICSLRNFFIFVLDKTQSVKECMLKQLYSHKAAFLVKCLRNVPMVTIPLHFSIDDAFFYMQAPESATSLQEELGETASNDSFLREVATVNVCYSFDSFSPIFLPIVHQITSWLFKSCTTVSEAV